MSATDGPSGTVYTYDTPAEADESDAFTVYVDGEEQFVHETPVAAHTAFEFEGTVQITIECERPLESPVVRPLSRGVLTETDEHRMSFALREPAKLSIEPDDEMESPLFLFARRPDTDVPDPEDASVRYFEAGEYHEPGTIHLEDEETIYVEGGAVVHGRVDAADASNVSLRGRGVIDGSELGDEMDSLVRFRRCETIRIEGVTILNGHDPDGWTTVTIACDDVVARDFNVVGWSDNDDGFDIVGCQDVAVERYFARTKDDPIVIKATDKAAPEDDPCGCRDVRNVHISDSTVWNASWGNAIEIGFETRCEEISGVVFEDMDVIHAEGGIWDAGGCLTIHNGDRAHVHDVQYQDIRIEDNHGSFIDFKVLESRYSIDEDRGHIDDITLEDISIVSGPFPPSILQGFDADHLIDDVTIDDLTVHGNPIETVAEAQLILERAKNVRVTTSD